MQRFRSWLVLGVVLLAVLIGGHAAALPIDPAARGLDVFLHFPAEVAAGGQLEIAAEAFGFVTVTESHPLANARLAVGWDPESLGKGAPPRPPTEVTTDAAGRARLVVPVPDGPPKELTLLLGARHGTHARVHTLRVTRSAALRVELHTGDSRVVPTSTISAWSRVAGISGAPLAGAKVRVSLLEGGVARHEQTLTTDKGGIVMARVPIPRIDEPVWEWTLRAELVAQGRAPFASVPSASLRLTPREETPGKPTLEARWTQPAGGALPGDEVPFAIRVHDATGQPLAGHPVRWFVGPKGTSPDGDEEWLKGSTAGSTDGAGVLHGKVTTPALVKTTGTELVLRAKSSVEGHALDEHAALPVGQGGAQARILPEGDRLVPGLRQRLFVRVLDARARGVAASFKVSGDRLATTVTTDEHGEGEIEWDAPDTVGATRQVGPCAGGVAAAIALVPTSALPELKSHPNGFLACVPVNRDVDALVVATPAAVRPGDKLHVTVTHAPSAREARPRVYSVIARSNHEPQAIAGWISEAAGGAPSGDLVLPADAAPGVWTITAAAAEASRRGRELTSAIVVLPKVAPLLTVTRTGGRAVPGGSVDLEAQLTDGRGKGLPGAVSAVVIDAFGGGELEVNPFDTRSRLCGQIGLHRSRTTTNEARCRAIVDGDPSSAEWETSARLLRAVLSSRATSALSPERDPAGRATSELKKSFADVLRSLEGAVFEATRSPETLIDVRRKEGGRWVFNPEMFTLVTEAMDPPPLMPGGERITLGDLAAVDPQVTFDNVARRVTRLKLFRVLAAVRDFRKNGKLDPAEPVFQDPNALLRRLVRSGTLTEDALLDPWGGTLQFVKANAGGAPMPFLSTIRGYELHAPGPDGAIGTADDVRDPFARVLREKSPYAEALSEDRIVDARWDMVVSEDTVSAWETMFNELVGTKLGGLSIRGVGEGGGGRGEGIGLGGLGTVGHGRGSGLGSGTGFFTELIRTDPDGKVKLRVPLGDTETTWRIGLVGVPDGLGPASTTVDVATEVPVSPKITSGARWVSGDVVEVGITLRNRTAKPVQASLAIAATGSAEVAARVRALGPVEIPANGAHPLTVPIKATTPGIARLVVTTRSPGLADDVLEHAVEVVPPGERRILAQSGWVAGERTLGVSLDQGYALIDAPRLVLERGYDDALASALDALEAERQGSTAALVDSLEAAIRIERWATTHATPRHRALAGIAKGMGERALGRYQAYAELDKARSPKPEAIDLGRWTLERRVALLTKAPHLDDPRRPADPCPPDGGWALEAEPPVLAPEVLPCWGAHVSAAVRDLEKSRDPDRVARAVLALAERPHRATAAAHLADVLRRLVRLEADGQIDGKDASGSAPTPLNGAEGRASRAIVYAALLRAQRLGRSVASEQTLFARLGVLRDASGGYGNAAATIAVVRALLASQLATQGVVRARIVVDGSGGGRGGQLDRSVDVPADGFLNVPLPPQATRVKVSLASGSPGIVARLERPVLRSWTRPVPPERSPVSLDVTWPADARPGSLGTLRVVVHQNAEDRGAVDVRIPLPSGATLAEPTKGMRELQGVLAIREDVGREGSVIEAPIRFGLGGSLTIPEAIARLSRSPNAPAAAPARTILVR